MEEKRDILSRLQKEAQSLPVPEKIQPEEIRKVLETRQRSRRIEKVYLNRIFVSAAACLVLAAGLLIFWKQSESKSLTEERNGLEIAVKEVNEEYIRQIDKRNPTASLEYPDVTYEEIYVAMFGNVESTQSLERSEEPAAAPGNMQFDAIVRESAAEESEAMGFGATNIRTQGIDEADIVKNDGRYLYQIVYDMEQSIQIVDTKEGLKEVKRLEGFQNISEFYVVEDLLIIIEDKYMGEPIVYPTDGARAESAPAYRGCFDYGGGNYFHEITFFNIKNRANPYRIKTFTLKGSYDTSRITEGYFYSFSKFYATPGEGAEDYESYIPEIEGRKLEAEDILLQDGQKGNCYLVLLSIDLTKPTEIMDSTAIITGSELYYVSPSAFYIAEGMPLEEKSGKQMNHTSLLRFSYEKGEFSLRAKGKIPGRLESSFSMDEYEENLRLVTTVDEYWFREIKDDITGEILGNYLEYEKRSNALYVLDSNLKVIGKIEDLAEEERIYSARFMQDTGYFVTFRQTDPLFAVDLKDPGNPKILSELKVSGFSEYLHPYTKDRLLGIGMEADPETGITAGMKLSMFDIQNPGKVEEIAKLHLQEYQHSNALYNYKAVMIGGNSGLFGFEAEAYSSSGYQRDYLLFSYEEERFVQKLKVNINTITQAGSTSRGTFIGDVFYLLTSDGRVRSYDPETGGLLETL